MTNTTFTRSMAAVAILLVSALISTHAYALRCGGMIITPTVPVYKVLQKCGEPDGRAQDKLYYERDGVTYTVGTYRGIVRSVDFSRF